MEKRPLTKEERKEASSTVVVFRALVNDGGEPSMESWERLVRASEKLLGDGAYWREAVKNLPEFIDESGGCHAPDCLFCKEPIKYGKNSPDHAPDCQWKLAQES